MELIQRFKAKAGNALFLERGQMENYLRSRKWLKEGDRLLKLEKPGEGNMNFVLRAQTDKCSLIVKQARPWVEKYPQIEAPLERVQVEAEFYKLIQQDEQLASFTPRLLDWDPDNYILILEDLGQSADFLRIYQKGCTISRSELEPLVLFITHLHHTSFTSAQKSSFPLNQALKTLNHEHVFVYPYLEENGFDLDTVQPGLQQLSLLYKTDTDLKNIIQSLGQEYLGAGSCLIHGDYYPGSWLKVADQVKVIDPEFGYFGRPEFDLGVLIAHLKMAQTPIEEINWVQATYPASSHFDESLRQAFTGVEMMRRMIGLAQLPLDLTLDEKAALMQEARQLLENWQP